MRDAFADTALGIVAMEEPCSTTVLPLVSSFCKLVAYPMEASFGAWESTFTKASLLVKAT